MWLDPVQAEKDLEQIAAAAFIPWEKLRGSTVLVTGGTGLIGYATISGLLYANRKKALGMKVLALVRDLDRAEERFHQCAGREELSLIAGSVEALPKIEGAVDYVIHGASQTAGKEHIVHGVEAIHTAVMGTDRLLQLAKEKRSAGFVYLSSMEVYGHPPRGHKVRESDAGAFDPLDLRNGYPISKQLCENLCCAYANEYGVPAKIIRLAQTFGAGVHSNDRRIFAEFGRCVAEKRDIVLKTKGETERSYLYIADAVTAILTILLRGAAGSAYNAADESTYCSIAEMARRIAQMGGVQVRFELQDEKKLGYPSAAYLDLDATLLKSLGWAPGGSALFV